MDSTWFAEFFRHDNSMLVFVNVLLQQLGLPVPSVPTLMLTASRSNGLPALGLLLAAAVLASLLADWVWYQAGKLFGYRVLALLCKMSINPGSCVNQTEARFHRWGVWSLVVGKFIPGFSTVAPPVAGALGMPRSSFLLASAIGAALWAGLALLTGYALQAQIDAALTLLATHGIRLLAVLAALALIWICWKYWQKIRFERMAAIPHISAEELLAALSGSQPPRIVDLRSQALIAETGAIPHAVVAEYKALTPEIRAWPKDKLVVTLCACPQDAAAVYAATTLTELGFLDVRPLSGGFEAWKGMAQVEPGLLVKEVA